MVILQFVIGRITKGEMMIKILMLLNLVNARSTIQHTRSRNLLGESWHYGAHILLVLVFIKSLAVKDGMMYSLLCMSILNEHRKWSFMTLLVSLVHTACLVSLYSLKILALQLMKCMPKVTLAVHKLRSPATTCKEELCCKM